MEHLKLFAVKFIVTFAVFITLLGSWLAVSIGDVFLISMVVSIVGYTLADRIILDRAGNILTTLPDVVIIFGFVYVMTNVVLPEAFIFTAVSMATLSLTAFEYFFHRYVLHTLEEAEDTEESLPHSLDSYQTETSEELSQHNDGK